MIPVNPGFKFQCIFLHEIFVLSFTSCVTVCNTGIIWLVRESAMEQPSWWMRFKWRHPEWWSLGVSLLAWLLLVLPLICSGLRFKVGHHSNHPQGAHLAWFLEMCWWIVMVVAMMLPLIVRSIRVTAARSLWARRDRAIFVFMLGYLAAWMLAGLVISSAILSLRVQGWFRPAIDTPFAFALAAVWQLTAAKGRTLRSCHRTIPMVPRGWRANLDCLRYGWMIGGNCLLSCGALMVACSLSGHSLAAMAGAGSISAAERYMARPNHRILSAAITAFGIFSAFSLPR
jgi:predicted metal-binding membrane protein